MRALIALVAGLLFGFGLLLSGMTNPANVIAFLDFAGDWRPALVFTMGAAVLVAAPAFAVVRRRGRSLRGDVVTPINRFRIDRRLLLGSAMFGIGWGLSGICPGPGLIVLLTGQWPAIIFGLFVAAGMFIAQALPKQN